MYIYIYIHTYIHTCTQNRSGLITPIVTDADMKGLVAISNEVKMLADKVCVCICVYVVWMLGLYIYIYIYIYIYMYMYTYVYDADHKRFFRWWNFFERDAFIYLLTIYMYIYIYIYMHTYIYTYVYTSIFIHMYMHIYVYICIYIIYWLFSRFLHLHVCLHGFIYPPSLAGIQSASCRSSRHSVQLCAIL
jgi:hypothetical protein